MRYTRMPIEIESPEELGYDRILYNLSESAVRDRTWSSLGIKLEDIILCYGDHRGMPDLREALSAQGPGLLPDHVLVTAGAAGALFIVATTLLKEDDHLVVVRPNYATNIETPKAIGARITYVDLTLENGYRLDLQKISDSIQPSTKLISLTVPHNPTGTMIDLGTMRAVVDVAERAGCFVLFDETYRDLTLGEPLPLAATLSPRAISVSSLSKAFGVPGIRIGWVINRDPELLTLFLAAKEQMGICGSAIDEYVGYQLLVKRPEVLASNQRLLARRLEIVRSWIESEPLVQWVEPKGGVVCFPRVDLPDARMEAFYRRLLEEHRTYLAPGHWFDMPRQYFRLGFGWPTEDELSRGLDAISRTLKNNPLSL